MAQQEQQQKSGIDTDPNKRYAAYRLDVAVAQEKARLYGEDSKVVESKYKALAGAQDRYLKARTEQETAWKDLKKLLEGIKSALVCDVKDRLDALTACWNRVWAETRPAEEIQNCAKVDDVDCAALPSGIEALGQKISEIRDRSAEAVRCVKQIDAEFDRLATLPEDLAPRIKALNTRALELEKDVCGSRGDKERAERGFVTFLQLNSEVEVLDKDRVVPAAYGNKLRESFAVLLKRHTVDLCLKVAVFRYDRWQTLEADAKDARRKNLVATVLEECRPPGTGQPGSGPAPAQPAPAPAPAQPAPAPAPAPAQPAPTTPGCPPAAAAGS